MALLPSLSWENSRDSKDDDDHSGIGSMQIVERPCNEANVRNIMGKLVLHCDDRSQNKAREIKSIQPHEKSAAFEKNKDFIGEIVYEREGQPIEKRTAEFGIKSPKDLECHAGKCNPDTQHARLHKELYDKCPEEEKRLVADGFSYQARTGFKFNSTTLNDKRQPYVNKEYYKEKTTRTACKVSENLIKGCLDQWANDKCPTVNWSFPTKEMEKK